MRTVAATLILAGAMASAAYAQAPASTAAPTTPAPTAHAAPAPAAVAPTVAPPPAAPASAAPVTTAPPATTPSTPPAPDATTAAATPNPPPAEEAAPTVPTSGSGAVVLSVVEKFCVPLVRGASFDDLAKQNSALGLKKNRRDGTWVMPLDPADKSTSIILFAPGSNKDVCRAEVHYSLNQDKPIVSAVNIWSFLHQPELILQANYVSVNADGVKRVQKSWEHLDAASSTAVNFTTATKPDDTSLNAKYSVGEIFYQERKF